MIYIIARHDKTSENKKKKKKYKLKIKRIATTVQFWMNTT